MKGLSVVVQSESLMDATNVGLLVALVSNPTLCTLLLN